MYICACVCVCVCVCVSYQQCITAVQRAKFAAHMVFAVVKQCSCAPRLSVPCSVSCTLGCLQPAANKVEPFHKDGSTGA